MTEITNVQKPKIEERCPHCGATWRGDGWTLVCPSCKKVNGGNR